MKLKQFTFLLILLAFPLLMNAQTTSPEFYLDNWQPKTISVEAFDTLPQTTAASNVTVTIDAASVVTKVPRSVYGHNAAAWGGKLEQSASLVKDITNLSPNIIRWPGGSMSDNYMWKATSKATCPKDLPPTYDYQDLHYGSNSNSWTMSLDSYYSLLAKTGSTGIITVNYGYARYGTGPDPVLTAAKYAADWVRYDNGRTRYWEIGNECFGSWESGYKIDTKLNQDGQPQIVSGDLYGQHCRVFIEEMRKAAREVGNDIKIGVVAMDANVTWDAVQQNWNKGMMKQVAALADFIVVHSYYTNYNENSTAAVILNSPFKTKDMVQYISSGLKTHAGINSKPMALTEWNIFATGSKQGVSFVNGMHGTMILGELIKNKFGQGSRWDFLNGWSDGDNHGLFSDGDPGVPTRYTPRAPFFYMYFFQKYFGDKMVASSVSGSSDVVAYASRFSSGQSSVVLVNKGTAEKVTTLKINNFKPGKRYYYYLLTGGTDNGSFSRKVYVNGKTTTLEGGGPADYATLKPYSDSISGDIKISLPSMSTVFLLIDQDTSLLSQTIQFDSIPVKDMNDSLFALSAVSSSGLPVDFATSNAKVAIVENGKVKIIGAGSCDIIAIQQGDTIYKPAVPVVKKLTVEKGEQTIDFPELPAKMNGDADFSPGATTSSGLPVTYTSSNPAVATIVNGKIQIKGVGTALITARQPGNVNYNAAVGVTRELVVTPATAVQGLASEYDFGIYPNPASQVVTIRFHGENNNLIIYNSIGSTVYQNTEPLNEIKIQVREIGNAGIYFVKAGPVVKKLIIEE